MKTTILYLSGFFVFLAGSNAAFAQLPNTGGPGTEGSKCKVLEGGNAGNTGTYTGDGWCCCTNKDGFVLCTECINPVTKKANDHCEDAHTTTIKGSFAINGNWTIDKSGRTAVISVTKNTISINMSSFNRPNAKGIFIDANTIRISFPDSKLALFGKITSANSIDFPDGTSWVKKK